MKALSNLATFTLLVSTIAFTGCTTDFIVKNISKDKINLLSPADSFHAQSSQITFWWDELDGADEYELQIVSPSFNYIQQLLLDSVTSLHQFNMNLSPGTYQWRVRGKNNGYETDYATRTFFVDTTTDLSNVTITLLSPADNLFTNKDTITFKWDTITGADDYRFQLVNNTSGSTIYDNTTSDDSIQQILAEGAYTWKVRAQNNFSNSLYSQRTITIDLTPLVAPTIVSPLYGDTLSAPHTLVWTADPSSVYDSLYIYTDVTLTNIVSKIQSTITSYNFENGINNDNYYWRVKSFDAAGNGSSFSLVSNFVYKQ